MGITVWYPRPQDLHFVLSHHELLAKSPSSPYEFRSNGHLADWTSSDERWSSLIIHFEIPYWRCFMKGYGRFLFFLNHQGCSSHGWKSTSLPSHGLEGCRGYISHGRCSLIWAAVGTQRRSPSLNKVQNKGVDARCSRLHYPVDAKKLETVENLGRHILVGGFNHIEQY